VCVCTQTRSALLGAGVSERDEIRRLTLVARRAAGVEAGGTRLNQGQRTKAEQKRPASASLGRRLVGT